MHGRKIPQPIQRDFSDLGYSTARSSRLDECRSRMKAVKSCGSIDTPRATSARRPSESRTPTVKYADEIDQVVQTYLAFTDQEGRLKRLSYGVYLLGSRKIGVYVKNGKPLVRIGGGAMVHLDVYLVNHS